MRRLRRNDDREGRLGGLGLAALLLVLTLVAAACGTSDGTDTTGDDADTTQTDGTEAPDDTEATDDTEAPDDTDAPDDTAAGDDERGTAADTYDEFNAMSGQERHDALVAAAQEEGVVVFYTASSGMEPIIEAFSDTYDIDVDYFRGNSDTVTQRLTQEYAAGFYGVDVFDDAEAFAMADQGMTYEYVNPELTDPIPGYDPATHVAATRLSVYTQAWNTDLVDESEIPATIDGFTDPKWEGRLGLDPRDWVWYVGVSKYYIEEEGWTQEEVDEMFRTLAGYSTYH